jgi:hypothetical protein
MNNGIFTGGVFNSVAAEMKPRHHLMVWCGWVGLLDACAPATPVGT